MGQGFALKDHPDVQVTSRAFKMSKSRGNVVNPDDVVYSFGADSLRLYEMFMGPLRETKVQISYHLGLSSLPEERIGFCSSLLQEYIYHGMLQMKAATQELAISGFVSVFKADLRDDADADCRKHAAAKQM